MPPLPLGIVKNKVLDELSAWADQVSHECLVMDQLEAALRSRDPGRLAGAIEAARAMLLSEGTTAPAGSGGGSSGGSPGDAATTSNGGGNAGGNGGGDASSGAALSRSVSQALRTGARPATDQGLVSLVQRAEEALAEERLLVACQGGSVTEIKRELHAAYAAGLGPGRDNRFVLMAEKILSLHQLSQNVKAAVGDRRVDAVTSMLPLGAGGGGGGGRPGSAHNGGHGSPLDELDPLSRQRLMAAVSGGHGQRRPGTIAVEKALRRVAIAEALIESVDAHDLDALLRLQAEAKAVGSVRGTSPDALDVNLQQQLEYAVKKERQRRDVAEWQRRKGEEGSLLAAELSRRSISPTKRGGAGAPKATHR